VTELLRTAYSRVERDKFGAVTFHFEAVGRARLSGLWGLLASTQNPMWVWERLAWVSLLQSKPHQGAALFKPLTEHMNARRQRRAIEAYAEARGKSGEDIDVEQVMKVLGGARELRGDGEN
jgi:hypothetical protein